MTNPRNTRIWRSFKDKYFESFVPTFSWFPHDNDVPSPGSCSNVKETQWSLPRQLREQNQVSISKSHFIHSIHMLHQMDIF